MLLRHHPTFAYCGLTIILSNPSRFDLEIKKLITGAADWFFNNECLYPDCNRYQCDIRLIDDKTPLRKETKAILLLGEKAHKLYTGLDTTLDEHRGNPIMVNGIPCISSFAPQDCCDIVNYEKQYNKDYQTVEEFMSEEIAAGEVYESKGRGKTKRSNYRFWLKHDTKKILKILNNNGVIPAPILNEPTYIVRPSSEEIIHILTTTKGDYFYYDMETDIDTADMRCFAFAFGKRPEVVYIVPTLDLEYRYAYSRLPQIIRAKCIAMRDNCTVAHNGALFDFLILAIKYHLPIGKVVYDTMVAQQRIYPDVEKSLGHCISLASFLEYHKNQGNHTYRTAKQAEDLYYYCGKDIYGMMIVHLWQMQQMNADPGLKASIEQAQKMVPVYLLMTLLGMKYDEDRRASVVKDNDLYMKQAMRIIKHLTGDEVDYLISRKTCEKYFKDALDYPVVDRTPANQAAYDEGALLILKQKYPENVVIDFLLKYRARKKESGDLQFKAWIK
jgi:hypothetical protein